MQEEDYYKRCVDYALETGWVQPEEKPVLIDKYLRPIYQAYAAVIQEIEPFLEEDKECGETLDSVVKSVNPVLERTERIGSAMPSDIMRSIRDYVTFSCTKFYEEYAATVVRNKIGEVIFN
jgi:hypothetical protein